MTHDTDLKTAVLAELKWEPSVSAADIGVTARDGVITLMGHVNSFVEKHAAETAAGRVKGVKAVAEEIEVRLPYTVKRGDDDIAQAAVMRLAWNSSVPENAILVTVENGWIKLTGQVDWNFQKVAAAQDLRWLAGVTGMSNDVTVKPRVDTKSISNDITQALHRSWFFDPKTVFVSADGGKVKLTGSVDSWWDRQTAGETAWAASGTTSVENDIRVN